MDDTIPQDTPQDKLNPETTFIYVLIDPRDEAIRYVGKSNDPQYRLKKHIKRATDKTHRGNWIKVLQSHGLEPRLHIIEETPYAQWQERERYWIQYYLSQGAPLTNETLGGEGTKSYTPEFGAKISAGLKGKKQPNVSKARMGMHLTPETKAKMSATTKGRKRPPRSEAWKQNHANARRGKKHTPEAIKKIADANTGKRHTEEAKAKISASLTGKPLSDAHKQAIVNANQRRTGEKRSPEVRARMSEAHKGTVGVNRGRKFSPEARANMSNAQKQRWAKIKLLSSDMPTLWDQDA
jgi:hypothetical protein